MEDLTVRLSEEDVLDAGARHSITIVKETRKSVLEQNEIEIPIAGEYAHVVQDGSVTVGGHAGYVFRRVYHVIWFIVWPIIYFVLIPALLSLITDGVNVDTLCRRLIAFAFLVHFFIEPIRIRRGILSFGMRQWEADRPSTQFWTGISVLFVLMFAPGVREPSITGRVNFENIVNRGIFAAPILWSLNADPILGELRRTKLSKVTQFLIGVIFVFFVWIISSFTLGSPWWYALFIPVLTVAAEYPQLKIIDDNAMMLLVPLVFTMVVDTFGRQSGAGLYDWVHSTPRYS
eukprot:243211_1